MEELFGRLKMPHQLLSDQDPEFDGDLFQEFCRWMEIDKMHSSLYQPACNYMFQRFFRPPNCMLAKVVVDNQKDWNEKIPSVMAAYRASVHEATSYTHGYVWS